MTRIRWITIIAALGFASATVSCDKPTPEDCEKALRNMQRLLNTDNLGTAASLQGEIRRCRGGSSKEAVACAIKADSLAELQACEFEKTGRTGSAK